MFRIATAFFVAALLLAADNPWAKVKELQERSELRVYKRGIKEPITAVFDEANDDRIIVVVKDKQMAIAKEDIDRIDARPGNAPRKVNVEKTDKRTDPDYVPRPNAGPPLPGTSSSSNVSFGSGKGDFQTIYRRGEASPKN